MADTDNTKPQQRGLVPYKPGQSGNPKGRPKGSRNKINEAFLNDFYEAWQAFGRPALMAAAWEDPASFVKIAASLLPKEMHIKDTTFDEMSDDELAAVLAAVRGIVASGAGKAANGGTSEANGSDIVH